MTSATLIQSFGRGERFRRQFHLESSQHEVTVLPNKQEDHREHRSPPDTIRASNIQALAYRALNLYECSGQNQVFISLVGCPGSGKSYVSSLVQKAINDAMGYDNCAVVLPMDGYHIHTDMLKEMGRSGKVIGDAASIEGATTTFEDLIKRRGAPWTYDAKTFYQDLSSAKANGEGSFPLYCRKAGDPIPDQIRLTKNHRIILVEGIYLNAFEDPAWAPLERIWDDKWYLDIPREILKERLVNRHLETWSRLNAKIFGPGRVGATAKAESNDMKNARWIDRTSRDHADLFITYDG